LLFFNGRVSIIFKLFFLGFAGIHFVSLFNFPIQNSFDSIRDVADIVAHPNQEDLLSWDA
jgi:hypothetical protein